jgi:hypothetical protein
MTIRYRRSAEALSAEVGEDVVALQAVRGFAYGMEGVTASVWQKLSQPITLDALVEDLLDEYEVDEGQCRSEVTALLEQLVAEQLVEALPS